jgi:hypothetical protein
MQPQSLTGTSNANNTTGCQTPEIPDLNNNPYMTRPFYSECSETGFTAEAEYKPTAM